MGKNEDNLLLAISLTLFTFVFFFFGFKISWIYFITGILFMIVTIWYWIKVKKDSLEE